MLRLQVLCLFGADNGVFKKTARVGRYAHIGQLRGTNRRYRSQHICRRRLLQLGMC